MRLPSPAGLLALAHLAASTTVTLHLPSTPAPGTLSPRTHATLTTLGRRLSAPLSAAHSFVFRNVSAGSYLADVHCPTDGFAPLRVDVGEEEEEEEEEEAVVQAWETYRGNDWGNKGEALVLKQGSDGTQGFEVRALGRKGYFMERPKLSMVIFIGMPKLVENMDEETRAEWEASQKENPMNSLLGGGGQQPGSALGNFDMAAYLAGSKKKESGGGGDGSSSSGGGGGSAASTSAERKAKNQGVRR
ncbi:hypothetical protein BBO_04383 [Beauveria brongniartii RCEF 3172]|uniref:ER membrane protein complex subunit 7 beta-sandwich domain-containing protein n=1 Tax=Beauveria brongniartii RCEF 3172 TaxID=1081107 RepID=A0A167EJH5_9HYPO|nr:hypothetical protein BBO_04383 [Beauveria brongniartii RCEF 3172]